MNPHEVWFIFSVLPPVPPTSVSQPCFLPHSNHQLIITWLLFCEIWEDLQCLGPSAEQNKTIFITSNLNKIQATSCLQIFIQTPGFNFTYLKYRKRSDG